jgi:hypothetical protein
MASSSRNGFASGFLTPASTKPSLPNSAAIKCSKLHSAETRHRILNAIELLQATNPAEGEKVH